MFDCFNEGFSSEDNGATRHQLGLACMKKYDSPKEAYLDMQPNFGIEHEQGKFAHLVPK